MLELIILPTLYNIALCLLHLLLYNKSPCLDNPANRLSHISGSLLRKRPVTPTIPYTCLQANVRHLPADSPLTRHTIQKSKEHSKSQPHAPLQERAIRVPNVNHESTNIPPPAQLLEPLRLLKRILKQPTTTRRIHPPAPPHPPPRPKIPPDGLRARSLGNDVPSSTLR